MNENQRLLVVGGGPAGHSTARVYREAGGRARVTLLSAEDLPPYRRPPLTKEYLQGQIERGDLPMQPDRWYEENVVELRLSTSATALDPDRRVVETANGEIPYDACVLATGSEPVRLPVPGGDMPEVLTMREFGDSERLQERVGEGDRAVVIGSGFIGCEAAASLSLRGAEVAQISLETLPQEQRLGEEAGRMIEGWLQDHGVELHLGVSVESIERTGGGFAVRLGDGTTVSGGTVLSAVGVRGRLELAEKAGLETVKGGVVADALMKTSTEGVLAVGDISFAHNSSAGRRLHVEHWGEALNHGRVAGAVLAGGEAVWDVAPGFWSTIGSETIKHVAWGDGWDEARFVDHGGGTFTVWYASGGVCVGVLTHDCDEDYERGRELVEAGAPPPE